MQRLHLHKDLHEQHLCVLAPLGTCQAAFLPSQTSTAKKKLQRKRNMISQRFTMIGLGAVCTNCNEANFDWIMLKQDKVIFRGPFQPRLYWLCFYVEKFLMVRMVKQLNRCPDRLNSLFCSIFSLIKT